jgi:hypothetical protein
MALRNERGDVRAAWRAFSGGDSKDGWRTIAVVTSCGCRVLAGRRFPANEEAILFGFRLAGGLASELPQGRGFEVCLADLKAESDGHTWVALCRQSAGSLELFETMVEDVISTIERLRGASESAIVTGFLGRIRAWQEFMSRGADGTLSPEAELGLVGELEMLRELIASGVPEHEAVDAWKGPIQAVHDFSLRSGAFEVKSTISAAGFLARIASLDQLDDTHVHPLFLAGLRFKLDPRGMTLPELAQSISGHLASSPPIERAFEDLLLRAGLSSAFSVRYTRRFRLLEMRVLEMREGFPRLTRAKVEREILTARYELDLDLICGTDVGVSEALKKIGVV